MADLRDPHGLFTVEGACWRPRAFTHYELSQLHTDYQIPDLAKVDERQVGTGIRLRKLIDLAGPDHGTRYMTVESADGQYAVSLPMQEIMRTAVIVYEKGGKPLEPEDGGPARFLIPFFHDNCANVKSIGRILISKQPGRDTRPSNRSEHDAVHAGESKD